MIRVMSSLLLLVASWILMVLSDETPGWLGWQEALILPVLLFAAWRAVKDLLEWYREEGGE